MTPRRQRVAIQGLGFVGSAMAIACAMARADDGSPCFDVVGVDLPTDEGRRRVQELAAGRFPFKTGDADLAGGAAAARRNGNLTATTDPEAYASADTVLIDVHLDVDQSNAASARVAFEPLREAIRTVGRHIRSGTLVIVETTVPPGTCERIVRPALEAAFQERSLQGDAVLLAHSFERVMPGDDYLNSIRNYWRVYAGHTEEAAVACETFLAKVIDTNRFPLTRLQSTTASETAKVMENAYRAVNIAFVEEWARFAERIGVDLFEVIDAIRLRPTHSNIRQPGFGVGGYCLTKDPLLSEVSARQIFDLDGLSFPFSRAAVETNNAMPLETLAQVEQSLDGLSGKRLLVMGVAYRQDVSDTRCSPAQVFIEAAEARGAAIEVHDPYVEYWTELDRPVLRQLPDPREFNAIILTVPHRAYRELDFISWIGEADLLVFDANNVLSAATRGGLKAAGAWVQAIGRGEAPATSVERPA